MNPLPTSVRRQDIPITPLLKALLDLSNDSSTPFERYIPVHQTYALLNTKTGRTLLRQSPKFAMVVANKWLCLETQIKNERSLPTDLYPLYIFEQVYMFILKTFRGTEYETELDAYQHLPCKLCIR